MPVLKKNGGATMNDKDTIPTAPWVSSDAWDTTIFFQVSNWNDIGLKARNYLNSDNVSMTLR